MTPSPGDPRLPAWGMALLFVHLWLGVQASLLAAALLWHPALDAELASGVLLILVFAHLGLSLHHGSFGPWRAASWVVLVLAWAAATVAVLLRPMLAFVPWAPDPALPLQCAALALVLDVAVLARERWRGRLPQDAVLLGAAVLAATALAAVMSDPASPLGTTQTVDRDPFGLQTPARIVPAAASLPAFALLRCVPDKLGGVAVMGVALLLPAIWPWVRAERFRIGRTRWAWPVLCLALGACWVWLGILGAQPLEGSVAVASRVAAGGYFAFFLLLPFLLGRIAASSRV